MGHPESKITSKSQTVIPREVREWLKVGPGDRLRYRAAANGVVVLERADSPEIDPFIDWWEWATPEDDEAFDYLQPGYVEPKA